MSTTTIIVLLVLALLLIGVIYLYNNLITLKNRYKNTFAQIDVQLTRRYDLIPNLVETAKAYMKHERETLEAVIAARNQAKASLSGLAQGLGNAAAMQALQGAEDMLSGALTRFFALSEAYPDLKASDTMSQLSEELTSTENKVAFARQAYNDAVMVYNTACELFPSNLVAGLFHFAMALPLELPRPEMKEAPRVSF